MRSAEGLTSSGAGSARPIRGASPRIVCEFGGRLTSDPNRSSLGLLPSGPDPVGEWLVHRQPPASYIGGTERECKHGTRGDWPHGDNAKMGTAPAACPGHAGTWRFGAVARPA